MREVTTQVFNFDELNDDAKKNAYNQWQEQQEQWGYECPEFHDFLKLLSSLDDNIRLEGYEMPTDYTGGDFEVTDAVISDEYDTVYMTDIVGYRAVCMVLALIHRLTAIVPVWVKDEQGKWRKSDERYNGKGSLPIFGNRDGVKCTYSRITAKNGITLAHVTDVLYTVTGIRSHNVRLRTATQMQDKDDSFDGTWLGDVFINALRDSIKGNTTCSYHDHVSYAFERIFSNMASDAEYRMSYENFMSYEANENEYLADGELFCG